MVATRAADEHGYAAVDLDDLRTDHFRTLQVQIDTVRGEGTNPHVVIHDIGDIQLASYRDLGIAHRLHLADQVQTQVRLARTIAVDDPDADDIANSPDSFGLNEVDVDGNCCLRSNTSLPARQYFFKQIVRATNSSIVANGSELGRATIRGPIKFHGEGAGTYTVQAGQPMLGFANTYRIGWYPSGRSLGELLYSLALAPCEEMKLAFIDWTRTERNVRRESAQSSERLTHELNHDRTIEETVDSVLTETQSGSSGSGGGALSVDLGFVSFGGRWRRYV